MTDDQRKRIYMPTWSRAFACNWRSNRGVIAPATRQNNPELAYKVADLAEAIATRANRRMDRDDLRHAAEMIALKQSISSKDMSNAQIDKCLALFRLLINEVHVASVIALDRKTPDRVRMEYAALNHELGRQYVEVVCHGKFGTKIIKGLSDAQLNQLLMTLKSRAQARRRKGQPVAPDPQPAKQIRTYQLQPAAVAASNDFDPYAGGPNTNRRGD